MENRITVGYRISRHTDLATCGTWKMITEFSFDIYTYTQNDKFMNINLIFTRGLLLLVSFIFISIADLMDNIYIYTFFTIQARLPYLLWATHKVKDCPQKHEARFCESPWKIYNNMMK